MIRVVLVDDHPIVTEGVARVMAATPDIAVVATASHGDSVLPLLSRTPCDVLVLDFGIPGLHGFDLLHRIKGEHPSVHVVVFSASSEEQFGARLVRAGAAAYLSKTRHATELLEAVRRAAAGQRYLTDTVADNLVAATTGNQALEALSDRELGVLQLLVDGQQPMEIARTLGIGPSTASSHLAHIREKVGARSNHELVRLAMERGILK